MNFNQTVNLVTVSIILSFSLYHFLLFYGRRSVVTEKYNLYFSLFSICLAFYIPFSLQNSSFIPFLIKNYNYDINPLFAYLCPILMIYFFVKIEMELLNPPMSFKYVARILFSLLFLIEIFTFSSLCLGYSWFKRYLGLYLTISLVAISITFLIIFIYYVIKKRKYDNPQVLAFSIAFVILGFYLGIFGAFVEIANKTHYNHGFTGIYIVIVAFALSLKSNNEFKELLNLKSELEHKIAERTKQLEILSKQKTTFFLNLAHETRTPLTLVSNYMEKYLKKAGQDDELLIIKNNIDKMQKDLTNYFDMERILSGSRIYDHERISCISEILEEKVILFKENAIKKKITIKKNISENIYVKVDSYALDRIINNLIENAIKFTKYSGKIEISLEALDKNIFFSVKDNGIGIEADKLVNIFEPFYQIQHEKRNNQGIGLGLSIVKNIIDSINAKIEITSTPMQGSVFTINFKRYVPAPDFKIDKMQISKPISITGYKIHDDCYYNGRKNIMVIEDNIDFLNFMHENISTKYNCFLAPNGVHAIEKLKSIPKPNIIISDIMMDEMDGFTFYDELQKNLKFNDIPMIFLTAKTGKENKYAGLKKGAVDYITKPFLVEELLLKIESIIRNSSQQMLTIKKKIDDAINEHEVHYISEGNQTTRALHFETKCRSFKVSDREKEIIKLLMKGYEYKEIGNETNRSQDTIKKQIRSVYKKCKVHNKIELFNIFR